MSELSDEQLGPITEGKAVNFGSTGELAVLVWAVVHRSPIYSNLPCCDTGSLRQAEIVDHTQPNVILHIVIAQRLQHLGRETRVVGKTKGGEGVTSDERKGREKKNKTN